MALVSGLVAVLRIVPLGDKVALRETVWRVLSASLTPAGSSVEEMLEESLRGGHPAGPVRSGGCSSQSLAAWPSRRPGAWCSSSSLTPPQDRENCHASGNMFVLFGGFKPVALCNLFFVKSNEISFSFTERTTESVWVGATPAGDFGP